MANPLEGCVSSLRSSMQLLDSSISILGSGVNDFPRLSKVLQTTRHFELVSEIELQTAQSALFSEIRPEVDSLLNRVDNYLDKLERREQSLIAKCELQEGRLNKDTQQRRSASRSGFGSSSGAAMQKTAPGEPVTGLEALKAKQLRQKRERLSYAVETLELQAKQKERTLRMSIAPQ